MQFERTYGLLKSTSSASTLSLILVLRYFHFAEVFLKEGTYVSSQDNYIHVIISYTKQAELLAVLFKTKLGSKSGGVASVRTVFSNERSKMSKKLLNVYKTYCKVIAGYLLKLMLFTIGASLFI
ncbi:hypothetical protein GQX74_008769 [Glossina fuscipes]|nr:hypothetical protein GQX74_008769 [Glossina fuscipes]